MKIIQRKTKSPYADKINLQKTLEKHDKKIKKLESNTKNLDDVVNVLVFEEGV